MGRATHGGHRALETIRERVARQTIELGLGIKEIDVTGPTIEKAPDYGSRTTRKVGRSQPGRGGQRGAVVREPVFVEERTERQRSESTSRSREEIPSVDGLHVLLRVRTNVVLSRHR